LVCPRIIRPFQRAFSNNKTAKIVAAAEVDAQALLKVIVALKADLKVLLDCVPTLEGLVLDAEVLVAADLQVILDLIVKVQALVAEVEVCLKALVVLKAGESLCPRNRDELRLITVPRDPRRHRCRAQGLP
jgi:hypothetical protein